MALVRVRGCAGLVPPGAEGSIQQADASRRQNGPRKATSRRPITVRLRGKSCLAGGHKASPDHERRAVVAMEGREPLSRRMWGRRPGRPGECPSNNPSILADWEVSELPWTDRTQGFSQVTYAEGGSRWKSPSKA